jgi:hypothetical protein
MSDPQVKVIYKIVYRTYTPARKLSIQRYHQSEKGKLKLKEAARRYYLKNKEKINKERRERYAKKKVSN